MGKYKEEAQLLEAFYAPYPIGEAYQKFHNKAGSFKEGVEMKDVLKAVEVECKKDEKTIGRILERINIYLESRK